MNVPAWAVFAGSIIAAALVVLLLGESEKRPATLSRNPTPATETSETTTPEPKQEKLAEPSAYEPQESKPTVTWLRFAPEAQRRSKKTGKPILLHLYASGCAPCEVLDRECFTDPKVIKAISQLTIPLKLNLDDDENRAVVIDALGIDDPIAVPAEILIDEDGTLLTGLTPCPCETPKEYLDHLKRMLR